MNHNKLSQAERLFDAMELLDDALITKCQTPQTARGAVARRHKQWMRRIALACVFTLIFTGALSAIGTTVLGGAILTLLWNADHEFTPEAPENSAPSVESDLTLLLADAARDGRGGVVDPDAIDFFDGTVKIIWREAGGSTYYASTLSSVTHADRMENVLSHDRGNLTSDQAESISTLVWISYGDGRVVSPYLKASAGNVGTAKLFDYEPEVEPDEALIDLLAEGMTP